ncbi:hypothetical protein ACFY05_32080 [Microtetraspora fusca]|uniref:RNA polymerase subunit sigma-70 n=1 Tax=Microtetraspora fusca TaxID=1997 RepID=A0ABW6VE46_MICFU
MAYVAAQDADGLAESLDPCKTLDVLAQRYRTLAVLHARIVNGASWAQVAGRLGIEASTARALYEEPEKRWRQGDPRPWAVQAARLALAAARADLPPADLDINPGNAADLAAELERFVAVYPFEAPE